MFYCNSKIIPKEWDVFQSVLSLVFMWVHEYGGVSCCAVK